MSAQSVSRWNAVPMSRSDIDADMSWAPNLKRSRSPENTQEDGDDDDDDVSLVSRSPSPPPMDVDGSSISKYDEYVSGTVREVITVETKIKNTNKGFSMLAKLGWTEGQPLGLSGDGRVDPIPFQVKRDLTGLGKTNQDVRMIETTVSQRRGLDSERQRKETEEQRKAREDTVARRAALQSEISTTLKAFYCSLCDKQFQNVAQYDEHTNSYAHHHKARFKDMQASQRSMKPKDETDKRKEKERKREEKELRKIAAAAGIKMAKPPVVQPPPSVPMEIATGSHGADEARPAGFKNSGWASLSSSSDERPPPSAPSGPRESGWASLGSSSSTYPPEPSLPTGGFAPSHPAPLPPATPHVKGAPAPAFRTAGWTSLDTGSSRPLPPSLPSSFAAADPPPPPPNPCGGWSSIPSTPPMPQSRWNAVIPQPVQQLTPPSAAVAPPVPSGRSGWQQFQSKGNKRR